LKYRKTAKIEKELQFITLLTAIIVDCFTHRKQQK